MKKGIIFALLASVLWAMVSPFIKKGIACDFSPVNFAGLRFTLVGTVLMIYTAHRGMWKEIRNNIRLFGMLILLNIFLGYATFYIGVDLVSADISSIIMGLTPLINVLLAHFLISTDRLTTRKTISLLVSLIGLSLIVGTGNNGSPLEPRGIIGIALLLLSILLQGYSAILVSGRRDNSRQDTTSPVFLNAVQMFFGGLMLYGAGVATEGFHPFWDKPAIFYTSLSILVLISIFAFSFWFVALRAGDTPVSDINMCRMVHPVIGAGMSWMLMADESPQIGTVSGMLIIMAALLIYFKVDKRLVKKHVAD